MCSLIGKEIFEKCQYIGYQWERYEQTSKDLNIMNWKIKLRRIQKLYPPIFQYVEVVCYQSHHFKLQLSLVLSCPTLVLRDQRNSKFIDILRILLLLSDIWGQTDSLQANLSHHLTLPWNLFYPIWEFCTSICKQINIWQNNNLLSSQNTQLR